MYRDPNVLAIHCETKLCKTFEFFHGISTEVFLCYPENVKSPELLDMPNNFVHVHKSVFAYWLHDEVFEKIAVPIEQCLCRGDLFS